MKRIILCIWFFVAFLETTSKMYPIQNAQITIFKIQSVESALHFDFSTQLADDCFYSLNWLLALEHSSENIKLINVAGQVSTRMLYGFDKLFQLLYYSKNSHRKFTFSFYRFTRLYSYRQIKGYYLFHLCKMLN
ncbi:MAG: hypothetical protein QM751_01830 [Paludibacteraceae bacterium]